jgi:hypothetical protein
MKRKIINKKAFTMFELTFATIVIIVVTAIAYRYFLDKQHNDEIKKAVDDAVYIVKNYVLNPTVGYINGSGGSCSDDNTFKDITAKRVMECVKKNGKPFHYVYDDKHRDKWQESYINIPVNFTGHKNPELDETDGCHLFFHDYPNDDGKHEYLSIYIDCNYIPDKRKRYMVEQMFIDAFKKNFADIYDSNNINYRIKEWYDSETMKSSDYSGSNDDGMLKIVLTEK